MYRQGGGEGKLVRGNKQIGPEAFPPAAPVKRRTGRTIVMMKKFVIGMIRFYRKYLSGLQRRPHCIYTPTCSQYALEAVEKYGVLKGGALAAWRILRCNPFAKGGYDPVP